MGYFSGGNTIEDDDGLPMHSTNLTLDAETGIGKWTEAQFLRALKEGVRPDDTAIRSPMLPYSPLTDDEARAIFAYLKTLPAIHKANLPQPPPAVPSAAKAGEKVYFKYACNGCHGAKGQGLCDVTKNKQHFATDDDLAAFIGNPRSKVPDSRMPVWQGVIKDDELKDLVAHVRSLDKN